MMPVTKIAPKWIAKWTDVCCTKDFVWIVRSDLKCVMKTTSIHEKKEVELCDLHLSCQMGDHYLATADGCFFIVKGDTFRRVTCMVTDANAMEFPLHPNCRGGTHYFGGKEGWFYVVFADKGKIRMVTNMATDENAKEVAMHQKFKDGLFYWADNKFFYCLKPKDVWGHKFVKTTCMWEDVHMDCFSICPMILPFLPGGFAALMGPCFGRWVLLKSFKNTTKDVFKWDKMVKPMIGCIKPGVVGLMQEFWCMKTMAGSKHKMEGLVERLLKHQFCMAIEYGGLMKKTQINMDWCMIKDSWWDVKVEDGGVTAEIMPGSAVFVWQWQLGMGDRTTYVFTCDMMTTTTCDPPMEKPIPAA